MKPFLLAAAGCAVAISGCVTAPIPDNYSGPISTVRDSALAETGSRAQFYFLSEIDGKRVDNILGATRQANSGRGFSLTPVEFKRDVPAKGAVLKLEGRVSYGAPIQELMNSSTVYSATRTVTAKLESNKTYVVKGVLTANKKDVWLEEAATGRRVD